MIALNICQMKMNWIQVSCLKIMYTYWLAIYHVLCHFDLEKLQLRNLMVQTMVIKSKWFELGMALYVPIDKLERLYDKYNDNPVKALVRVFRYWLADKNGLKPTWEKLIAALQDIKEYNLAIGLEKSVSRYKAHP